MNCASGARTANPAATVGRAAATTIQARARLVTFKVGDRFDGDGVVSAIDSIEKATLAWSTTTHARTHTHLGRQAQ